MTTTDESVSAVEHLVSIIRAGWHKSRRHTWLDLEAWRQVVADASDLEAADSVPSFDPRIGRVVPQHRPDSALWTRHPSGVAFVFLWRLGRLEVGAMYPEEGGGTTFALSSFDAVLEAKCKAVATALGAVVGNTRWTGASDGTD